MHAHTHVCHREHGVMYNYPNASHATLNRSQVGREHQVREDVIDAVHLKKKTRLSEHTTSGAKEQ